MTQQTNLGLVWAKNGGVTPVDNTKYESGWVAEIPTYQNFNYQVQTTDKNILKYAEEGVYDWEAIISYKPGARVIVDGKRYTCKANALNKNPTTDTSGSFWVEGWLVGNSFTGLRKTDGSKIELAVRPNINWTGQDQTIVNLNPMTAYVTTNTSKNWAISNVDGEMTVVDLGTSSGFLSPNGANLAKGAGKTFRLYHEGFKPTVSDVAGGVEEAPADGKYYARVGLSGTSGQWVKVTTNQVSATIPKPAVGSGMGWYNLADGTYYIDIFDGDSSQWVPASPPMIPIRDASDIGFEPKTSGLGDNVQTAIERVNNSKLNLLDIQESTGNSNVYPMSQQSVTSALGSYKQQAIDEATSIAALDATAKVDAVEAHAENYTDTAITNLGLGTASTHDVGTGTDEIRTNSENDARFGIKGTTASEVRVNSENDAKFVDKTRTVSTSGALSGGGDLSANRTLTVRNASTTQTGVVQLESGLTSTSTTKAATASTVKALKDDVDTAQGSANLAQAYANTALANAADSLKKSQNLADLSNSQTALGNIGIRFGTVTLSSNSSTSINLGRTVLGATVSVYTTDESANQVGCTWSGTTLNIRNSLGGTNTVSYIALVS